MIIPSLPENNFVALLGTKGGPSIRPGSGMPTSSLVQLDGHLIVVDCGLGVTRSLTNQGMELKKLSLIFITHLHSDHYLELGPLIHTAWVAGRADPITVIGPSGLTDYWQGFLQSMKADIELRIEDEGRPDLSKLLIIKEMDEGTIYDEDGIVVSAMRNEHPPIEETYALCFQARSHKIVFSGDTAFLPKLAEFADQADLLVHEAMLKDALEPLMARIGNADDRLMKHWLRSHTFARDAAKIAAMAKVPVLALHHLIPSDDPDFDVPDWERAVAPHYDGKLVVGHDGLRIDLD